MQCRQWERKYTSTPSHPHNHWSVNTAANLLGIGPCIVSMIVPSKIALSYVVWCIIFFFFLEISNIPDRTVTLGTNTTFTCSATGPGDIFYRWNRTVLNASGVLTEIGFYNESRVRGQHTSTLMVINVGVRDRGHYTCFVSFNSTNTRDRTAILSTHGEWNMFCMYTAGHVCAITCIYITVP